MDSDSSPLGFNKGKLALALSLSLGHWMGCKASIVSWGEWISVGVRVCIYIHIWIGHITSSSQPDLTERIAAQFLSSVHIRNWWIPQVCKLLNWYPLKFSHHKKVTRHLYVHYSYWRKGSNLSCILSLWSRRTWQIRKPHQGLSYRCL